jgi:hypothetical protein
MKRLVTPFALAALVAAPAHATDVGVSVSVSQPGVYGRIDIGRFPQPQVVVQQPVIVAPPQVVVAQPPQPVYVYVPYGQRKHWSRHCHRYDACGVPVYFVRHDWYHQQRVVVDHRHHHGHHGSKHAHKGGKRHQHDRDDD